MAFGGVGVCRIVIDAQVIDEREETDEVLAAAVPSFADFFFGDVVSAVDHATADAAEVQFGAGQAAEPKMQIVTATGGLLKQAGDGVPAERCLEPIVSSFGDRLLEE